MGVWVILLLEKRPVAAGADYLRDYYAFTGPLRPSVSCKGCSPLPQAIAQFVRGYADAGL